MATRGGQNFSSCRDQQMNGVNLNSIRCEPVDVTGTEGGNI